MKEKFIVSKSNKLINGRYSLGVNEQKIILTMISLIDINDKEFNKVTFTMREISNLLDISINNLYRDVRKIMRNLRKKDIFIDERDENGIGRIIETSFVTTAVYDNKHGLLTLEFSNVLKPYLLELKGLFTSYRLDNALSLCSKYSIRVYEKLKCNEFKKSFIWNIEELKEDLMLNQKSYNLYSNIKQKIILVSINDINKNTDIKVTFEEIKTGRKITAIKFYIKENRKLKNKINLTNENIETLKSLFNESEISTKDLEKIFENSGGDIEKIKRIYEYSKNQNIENLVGFMIKMVKDDSFQEPIRRVRVNKKIHNFTERNNYDYKKLEEELLGWSKYEDEDIKSENKNSKKDISRIRSVLEKQLLNIFGELRYKIWIEPVIYNMEIENNNINFKFSSDLVKKKFENEFESIIKKIILEIDKNLIVNKL